MVNKVKINLGETRKAMFHPEPSRELRDKIKAILGLDDDRTDDYIAGLGGVLAVYRIYKEEDASPVNTKTQMREAANEIKKYTEELLKRLSGDAGNLAPYLKRSVSLPLRKKGYEITLGDFLDLLRSIEKGSDHYLNDIYPNIKKVPEKKQMFTRDVMVHYEQFLGEKATTTIELNGQDIFNPSKFCEVLQAAFYEVDGEIPKGGNLKNLMNWALNNRQASWLNK